MDVFKTRFKFHGEHISALIIFFIACLGTIKLIVDPYDKYGRPVNDAMPIVVVGLWILFGFLVYLILKIPVVTISEDGIFFKTIFSKRNITWREIEKIDVLAKRWPAFGNPEEASLLLLITGEKVYVRIELYKNGPEIRQLLDRANELVLENRPVNVTTILLHPRQQHFEPIGLEEAFTKFKGTPYFNFNALLFYGLSLAFIIGTRKAIIRQPEVSPVIIIPVGIFYFAIGSYFNHFYVSKKHLLIRNAFLWWKRQIYAIDDIRQIIFEVDRRTKMNANAMKVITKDFKVKIYPAAGLWAKHWKTLKQHLESIGVSVTDDIGL